MKNSIAIALLSVFIIQGCAPKIEKEQSFHGEAQGTTYSIKYIGEEQKDLKQTIDSLLKAVDASMSTWVPSSKISQLNQNTSIQIDPMFKLVFEMSQKINQASQGAFDPSIGPLIEAWGFDYTNPILLDSNAIDSLLLICGMNQFQLKEDSIIKLNPKSKLNFNAIAQGYSVDLMAVELEKLGIERYFIELGGEVLVRGKNKQNEWWRVGIDKPEGTNLERKLSAIVNLENRAMVTSGNYRSFVEIDGKKYSHSLNPKTGRPVKHNLLSATIFAPTAAEADAWATACMVMGLEKAIQLIESSVQLDAVFIFDQEGSLKTYISEGIKSRTEETN